MTFRWRRVLLAAGSGGGVTDLRTAVALTSVEAKGRLPLRAILPQAWVGRWDIAAAKE